MRYVDGPLTHGDLMPEDPKTHLTATVTLPATTPAPVLPGVPQNWTLVELASLARHMAVGMYERATILSKFMITEAQCQGIEAQPAFQKLLEQAVTEWNKPTNINDRLALEAAVGLEMAMPSMISRMQGPNEPLQGVVQAGKLLTEIAGAGGDKGRSQGPAEKFKIVINLGGDKQIVEKSITIDNNPTPGEVPPVQSLPEGTSAPHPAPAIARREGENT